MRRYLFLVLMIGLGFISCSDIATQQFSCYQFDQRQCQTDEFGPDIAAADPSDWTQVISDYLESKLIEVEEAKVNLQYYDAVCEACDVCPEVHRFYVQVAILDGSKMNDLNLMNLQEVDCDEFFN